MSSERTDQAKKGLFISIRKKKDISLTENNKGDPKKDDNNYFAQRRLRRVS